MICQNCGSLLRPRRRDCSACGGLVSRFSPTSLIALKAGGPEEKCIPAPPNDHLLLERVVTLRATDRLSETSPCRGKKNCNHGVDGKRDDDAAGSVLAARSFTFGAALDGNVVSARTDGAGGSEAGSDIDTTSGASSLSAEDEIADLYERAQRESAFRSQEKLAPGADFADTNGTAKIGTPKSNSSGDDSSVTGRSFGKGTAKAQSRLLSKVDLADGSGQKPPLKMVLTAAAIGIFVLATACFTFLKPNAATQQAQLPSNSVSSTFPSDSSFPAQPSDPQFAGMMPPNIAGNWKVQVVFPGAGGQPLVQEFIASVRQSAAAIEGNGADSSGPFTIRGTLSVNHPYTVEFQKAYDASSSALPINFKGELADDQAKIGFGQCVMRIARGGGVLARARSDMLEGSWTAERTTQAPAPASQFPQPSGSNVTAILGVLLAVGISAFMFLKQRGLLPGQSGTIAQKALVGEDNRTNGGEKRSSKGKTKPLDRQDALASDEPEELASDDGVDVSEPDDR